MGAFRPLLMLRWISLAMGAVSSSSSSSSASAGKRTTAMTSSSQSNGSNKGARRAASATASSAPVFASTLPPYDPSCRCRLYLLRHGETDWNAQGLMQGGGYDIPLNSKGRRQAEAAAKALATIPLDVVASSHLMRASQTADAILELQLMKRKLQRGRRPSSKPPPRRLTFEGFGEMRFGNFEGLAIHGDRATEETRAKFLELNERMKFDLHQSWPGKDGESTARVETRARDALKRLLTLSLNEVVVENDDDDDDSTNERHVAVVAHGRLNKILLASLLEGDATQFGPIKQGNTCINVIDCYYEGDRGGNNDASEIVAENDNDDNGTDNIGVDSNDCSSDEEYRAVVISYVDHAPDIPDRHK